MTQQPAVLIIDDDEDLREIAVLTLQQVDKERRFEHLQAPDGPTGIEMIEGLAAAGRPILVLCDYRMPLIDGLGVAVKVRHLRERVTMEFVLLSSLVSLAGKDVQEGLVDQVLEKGFRPKEWRDQFHGLLDAFQARLDAQDLH